MASIFYNDTGEGFPVVFLHGFCETSDIWSGMQSHLSKNFRVITLDLPGFGGSPLLNYTFSLEDVAKEIKSFLDTLKLTNYVMIGHSLGGYITLAFSKLYIEQLSGIGLFHSSVFEDDEDKKENRTRLMELIKVNGVRTFVKTFIPSLFYKENIDALDDVIRNLKISADKTRPESVIEYARAMRDRYDSEKFLRKFKRPVMFIVGEEDPSVPLSKSLEQITMPENSHVLRLAGAGHMGMLEKPDETSDFIEGFLKFCR
jgi:pimeloyl-ACP methyl ester carboxylesterase